MDPLKIYLFVCLMLIFSIEARLESDWHSDVTDLLCNHPGSRSDKAIKIRDELHSTFPDFSFYVSVMNDDVFWSYYTKNSCEKEEWKDTCGYNMFMWHMEDSKIEPCSSEDISTVEDIIRTADSQGFNSIDVKFDIDRLMKRFGIDFHFIYVDDGKSQSSHASHFSSVGCSVAKRGNHDVFVYLK